MKIFGIKNNKLKKENAKTTALSDLTIDLFEEMNSLVEFASEGLRLEELTPEDAELFTRVLKMNRLTQEVVVGQIRKLEELERQNTLIMKELNKIELSLDVLRTK